MSGLPFTKRVFIRPCHSLGVDEDIVWQVVTDDLPRLVAALESIVPPEPDQ
jgi:uncharacterized protein with HEPN domain